MGTLTAAVVLAWIVLVLLAFAMAGILRQLRVMRAALRRLGAGDRFGRVPRRELPMSVRPRSECTHAAVLLVDDHCPVCAEIAPVFASVARSEPADLDLVAVSYADSEKWATLEGVRFVPDAEAFHLLDPGWRPAILVVGRDGEIHAAHPAGSAAAVRSVVSKLTAASTSSR